MAKNGFVFGEEVIIPWGGLLEVRGTVDEVYGPASSRHVVVRLTPELTGTLVDEPTTVSLPIDAVKKVVPAG